MPRQAKSAAPAPEVPAIVAQQAELADAVEAICFKMADGQPPTVAELQTLGVVLPDHKQQDAAVLRYRRIRNGQRLAGTPEERERVATELADAETALAERGPLIRQQIGALERELETLERAIDPPAKRLQAMEAAVEYLQRNDVLPEHVQSAMRLRSRFVRETFKELLAAESRVKQITDELALIDAHDPKSSEWGNHGAQPPSMFDRLRIKPNDADAIAAYADQISSEREQLQRLIDRQSPARDAQREEIEVLRRRYVPQDA